MKHAYLNNVLIRDFIYIIKIHQNKKHKKNKNSLNKKKTLNRGNTYLLIWWRFIRILARDCRWMPSRNQRKKFEIKGEERKRWKNELKGRSLGFIGQFYRRIHRRTIKKIILIYSVDDIRKSIGNFWISHQHF